jgi:hypothetical protein
MAQFMLCPCAMAQQATSPALEVIGFDTTRLNAYRDNPEYQYQQKPPEESLFKQALQRLKEFLLGLFRHEDGLGQNLLKTLLLIGAFVLLVYFFMHSRIQALLTRRNRKTGDPVMIFNEHVNPDMLKENIAAALRTGDFRSAFRWTYVDLIRKLDSSGRLKILPQKTNRDYIQDVQGLPFREDFTFLAHAFDYAWYGEYPVTQPDFEKYQALAKEILLTNAAHG